MLRFFHTKKGQSTIEYVLLIAIFAAALVGMHIYLKRSVQGRLRSTIDDVGSQYSAGNVTSKYTTSYGETKTEERFGVNATGAVNWGGIDGKGITYQRVDVPGPLTQQATGGDAEKIIKKLSEETLFPGK